MYKILKKEYLANNIWLMDIEAPRVAKSCQPGQFVIVKMDEKGERIPLTVCDYDREKGTVTIVFQTVGASTTEMAKYEVGESFMDFVGPLGCPSELIEMPLEELKKEINRVSKDTEFNTKSLLDGSIQRRVYGTNATRMAVSSNVTAADYTVTINQAAETAKKDADTVAFNDMTATIGASGKVKINSSSVEIEATDTYEQVFEKIRTAGELGETTVKADGGKLSFESTAYGETGKVCLRQWFCRYKTSWR